MRARSTSTPKRRTGAPLLWFAGALFLPFVLVLILLAQTARSESGRRATEARVLADYGAFAAAEIVKWADSEMHLELTRAFDRVVHTPAGDASGHAAHDTSVKDPALLLSAAGDADPAISRRARTALRFDAERGLVVRGVAYDSATRSVVGRRLVTALRDTVEEPHRLVADTIAGEERLLWLWIEREMPRRPGRPPRAVYGIETRSDALADIFGRMLREHQILPAGLLEPPYPPEALSVVVSAAGGRLLWSNGAAPGLAEPGIDTLSSNLGAATVRVHAGPRLASVLRIGRPSPLYLPMLVALLALSLGMGAIAMIQLRRTREMADLRERFVANVSHELRTPLTQMSMFAEMLETSRVRSDDEARHYAAVIRRETRRLTSLVESVLHFAGGRRNDVALQKERRDLAAEIADAVAFFDPVAAGREARVRVELASRPLVTVDPSALRQVLLNLLDNAVKYGPPGQEIRVSVAESNGAATVTVSDEGPGIRATDRKRVFDPYVRVDHPGRASIAGAGIGLAVVRQLVEAHGGAVWIADRASGTAVVFSLPVDRAGVEAPAVPIESASR